MNEHPIKFEFVEVENLLVSDGEQLVVLADYQKKDDDFLIDLIQKIIPEYKSPALNWGAFTDYLCELDEMGKPNTVIAHQNLPVFEDPKQIDHYIQCLGEASLSWRAHNPKLDRLVIRFLMKDKDYVTNAMNEYWREMIASPYFDPKKYGVVL